MKKLLFGLTAAAALVACADDIESANVVGFNTLETGYASQMLGATFQSVGGDVQGITLGQLTGNFQDEDQIQVSFMDEDGYIQFNVYTYLTEDAGFDENGWYDGELELANDFVIPLGSAVWFITVSGDPASVTTSGDVVKATVEHPAFVESSSMICSAYPVPFNPNSESVKWEGLMDEDQIQVSYMDEDGYVQFNVYMYLTEDAGFDQNGWYDGELEYVEEPIAEIGQGFWLILQDCEAVKMTESSPIAE